MLVFFKPVIIRYYLKSCFYFPAFFLSVTEVFLVGSEEWKLKRACMYGYKHPQNIVPVNFYIPGGFIDLSAPPFYYIYFCLMPYFAIELTCMACLVYLAIGNFSIHIKGRMKSFKLGFQFIFTFNTMITT